MAELRTGGQHVVAALKDAGVEVVFSLSGGQILPVYDALIGSGIRLIHTRHEGAAVYMAEAYAQMTGKVGVAMLCAGPGYANGLSAMYTACQSQTPVLVLSGDTPLRLAGQGPFQAVDQVEGARAFTRAAHIAESAGGTYGLTRRSMAEAQHLRGAVHLSLPVDVLQQTAAREAEGTPGAVVAGGEALALAPAIVERLRSANRPLVFAGPDFAHVTKKAGLRRCAVATGIPFVALESPRGMVAPRIGALAELLPECDLVLLLSQPPNFLLGFGNAPPFGEETRFIYCDEDADALREASARLGDDRLTAVRLCGQDVLASLGFDGEGLPGLAGNSAEPDWLARVEEAIAWRPPEWRALAADQAPFHVAAVAYEVEKFIQANPDLSLVIDGGEVGQWCQSILDCPHSMINGPAGSIGGSIPYAIAARAARPDHPVVAMLGDGTAGFHFMEYETAIREDLPMVAIVCNDARWNAEHVHQMRDYGENRAFGCEMHPTRYDDIARAMGGYGENVTSIGEVVPAIERAVASGKPACLNIAIESVPAPAVSRKG